MKRYIFLYSVSIALHNRILFTLNSILVCVFFIYCKLLLCVCMGYEAPHSFSRCDVHCSLLSYPQPLLHVREISSEEQSCMFARAQNCFAWSNVRLPEHCPPGDASGSRACLVCFRLFSIHIYT